VAPPYADNLRKNVEMLRRIGVNTVVLSPSELKALQPAANVDDIGAAAYEPESGYASPADTVEGLRRRATELGASIRQWTPVTKLVLRDSRVVGVETSTGRIEAGAVVVAGRRVGAAALPADRPRASRPRQGDRHGGGDAARRSSRARTWSSSTTSRAATSGPRAAFSRSSECRARCGTSIPTDRWRYRRRRRRSAPRF
jgi:hypothetical protein